MSDSQRTSSLLIFPMKCMQGSARKKLRMLVVNINYENDGKCKETKGVTAEELRGMVTRMRLEMLTKG